MDKLNKKVLIAEDDKELLSILQTKFADAGFSVVTAKNGVEGFSVAQKESPDLIISDILMPKMDGMEMVKKIREYNSNALIIFLTNIKDVDYVNDIKIPTKFDYLIKSDLKISEIIAKAKAKLGLS
jgi:two-component system, OmpR family, alkaline phosphatase synthesis response regulator PhoP